MHRYTGINYAQMHAIYTYSSHTVRATMQRHAHTLRNSLEFPLMPGPVWMGFWGSRQATLGGF